MTANKGKKPMADHQAVAEQCRSNPRQWVLVNTYAARYVARSMAAHIERGHGFPRVVAYRPLGHFEGKIEMAEDGWEVWARYNGPG